MTERYYRLGPYGPKQDRIENEHQDDAWKKRLGSVVLGLAIFATGAIKGPQIAKSVIDTVNPPTEHIDSETFDIKAGGNVISGAQETVAKIADRNNIDISDIPNDEIVYESQDAAHRSLVENNQEFTQPHDSFNVEITKSGSKYHVDIEPKD